MPFTISRTSGKKPEIKSITTLNNMALLAALADSKPAGGEAIALQSMKIGTVTVTEQVSTSLNKASVTTTGVAAPSKAVTTDSNKDINGVNRLSCSQLYIDNVLLDPGVFNGGALSLNTYDANRVELTGVTAGVAAASKAVVLDANMKASGINSLGTEAISAPSGEIIVNPKGNQLTDVNTINPMNYIYTKTMVTDALSTGQSSNTNATGMVAVAYSANAAIFVAVFSNFTLKKSIDGISWFSVMTSTDISYVAYFKEIDIFVAISRTGLIYSSQDGTTWTSRAVTKILAGQYLKYCEYSHYLGVYVVTTNGRPYYSYDLDNWYVSESPNNTMQRVRWIPSSRMFLALVQSTNTLAYSMDGKVWGRWKCAVSGQSITDIAWCPTSDTIVVSTYFHSNRSHVSGLYSKDGGATFKPFTIMANGYNLARLAWIDELGLMIGMTDTNVYAVSQDGMYWRPFSCGFSASCVMFRPYDRRLLFVNSSDNSLWYTNASAFSNASVSPLWQANNGKVAFNAAIGSGMLTVGSDTGKAFKFSDVSRLKQAEINIDSGVLTIKAKSLNFACTTFAVGGTPVKTNYLKFLNECLYDSAYYPRPNYLLRSSNGNISHTGCLSVSQITPAPSSNIPEYSGNTVGQANASKFLLADVKGHASGISKIGANEIKIGNHLLTASSGLTADLENTFVRSSGISGATMFNNYTISTSVFGTHNTADKIYYFKEIDLLTVVRNNNTLLYKGAPEFSMPQLMNSYTFNNMVGVNHSINDMVYVKETGTLYCATSGGLHYTNNKTFWPWKLAHYMSLDGTNTYSFAYSPSLNTYVVATDSGTLLSRDGIHFKQYYDTRFNNIIRMIKWIPAWEMFVGVTNTNNTTTAMFIYSYDGALWTFPEIAENASIRHSSTPTVLTYSPKLNMLIAKNNTYVYYTYNGKDWMSTSTVSTTMGDIEWIQELDMFVAGTTSTSTYMFYYSYNGIKWIPVRSPAGVASATYASFQKRPVYIRSMDCMAFTCSSGTAAALFLNASNTVLPNYTPDRCAVTQNMSLDLVNNRVGLGVQNPQFSLQLSEDLAFKPTSSTWITSSDQRLKEDIQDANEDICKDNIMAIPVNEFDLDGEHQLGWVAQEVEGVIPKAVVKKETMGFSDCRTLNNDQIIANMYGAVRWLIGMDKHLDSEYFET